VLKIWDWMQGKVLREVEGVEEAVRPFVKVRAKLRRRLVWNIDDGDDGAENVSKNAGSDGFKQGGKRGRRAKKRVAKALALAKLAEEEERGLTRADEEEQDTDNEDAEGAGGDGVVNNGDRRERKEAIDVTNGGAELTADPASDDDLVLVIHKIDSFQTSEGGFHIVFSAVG
jgi:hypothetical protein